MVISLVLLPEKATVEDNMEMSAVLLPSMAAVILSMVTTMKAITNQGLGETANRFHHKWCTDPGPEKFLFETLFSVDYYLIHLLILFDLICSLMYLTAFCIPDRDYCQILSSKININNYQYRWIPSMLNIQD